MRPNQHRLAQEALHELTETFWCKLGDHLVPVARLIEGVDGHGRRRKECLHCASKRTPPVRVVDENAPHRVPRVAPDTPEHFQYKGRKRRR